MKSVFPVVLFLVLPVVMLGQNEHKYLDSLKSALEKASNDTARMNLNRELGFYFQDSESDPALVYHNEQLALAKRLDLKLWEADAYQQIAYCYANTFHLTDAYENYMKALKIVEDPASSENSWGYAKFSFSRSPEEARLSILGMIHWELSNVYKRTRDEKETARHLFIALGIGEKLQNLKILSLAYRDIGANYLSAGQLDSAVWYLRKSLYYYERSPYQKNKGTAYGLLGQYYTQKKQYDSALVYLRGSLDENIKSYNLLSTGNAERAIGNVYKETGQLDSALYYTLQSQLKADSVKDLIGKTAGFIQLASIYQLKKDYVKAYDYLNQGSILRGNLADGYVDRLTQFQNLSFDQKFRLQELERESQQAKSRNRMYAMLSGLGVFLLVALILYRNNRQKQRANKELENTLAHLRATQSQLIQSEKMASLGELTAGIAHEIQNPLNFVNNFSEVNCELIEEQKEELQKGNTGQAETLAQEIVENEKKILFHGKRADTIVKGMLQHSRNSTGEKELTDINAMCDEYLRLAYHGLRAKDKSFNAKFETRLDPHIGSIRVVSQDIARVLLNLINNAFYAVAEKKKITGEGYEPAVQVSTRRVKDKVEIEVEDNGNGIPDSIREKIFQPFFTTKPAGQGTGLGLSLSYDIIQAHGGELKLETKEGKGSSFLLKLPVA
ncbi:MAG: ATP-binding protein [Chitinophagaceae bacterium]